MIKKILFLILFVSFLVQLSFPVFLLAQEEYKVRVLAPLPGTTLNNCTGSGCETTLQKYLPGLFRLLIGIAAVFAVVMIVVGGFQYMTTDALSGKEEGKARIWNAVKGLVLVIGASLILLEINPSLLKLNLSLEKVAVQPVTSGGGGIGAGGSNRGTCSNCQAVSGLTLAGDTMSRCRQEPQGCSLNREILNKLQSLNGQTQGLVITEVWPPTRVHVNECHRNGTCVDAVISNMSNINTIKNFINTANQNGIRAVFETSDSSFKEQLIRAGVSPDRILVLPRCSNSVTSNCITGTHFSLYNN